MIASLILITVIVILTIPTAIVTIPWAILTGNVNPLYNASLAIVRIGYKLCGIRIITEGLDLVPPHQACIFMANHVSNLDPPALLPRIPGRTSAFVKSSLMKVPIFGWGLKLGEFIPVSRDGSATGAQQSVAAARRVLEKGVHITTFVEGTRSKDGRMLPFKKGPFFLAMQTGAPCIPASPVFLHRNHDGWHSQPPPPTRGRAPDLPRPRLPRKLHHKEKKLALQAVRAAISSGLPEWMRNDPPTRDE